MPHNCAAQNAQKIFRQIGQKAQAIPGVLSSIFGRYGGIIGKQDAWLRLCGGALRKMFLMQV